MRPSSNELSSHNCYTLQHLIIIKALEQMAKQLPMAIVEVDAVEAKVLPKLPRKALPSWMLR
jgi:hypothetical protein